MNNERERYLRELERNGMPHRDAYYMVYGHYPRNIHKWHPKPNQPAKKGWEYQYAGHF